MIFSGTFNLFAVPLTFEEHDKCYRIVLDAGNRIDQIQVCSLLIDEIDRENKNLPYQPQVTADPLKLTQIKAINTIFDRWKETHFRSCSKDFLDKLKFDIKTEDIFDGEDFKVIFSPAMTKMIAGELEDVIFPERYRYLSDDELIRRANEIILLTARKIQLNPKFPFEELQLTESQRVLVSNWLNECALLTNRL